MNRVPLSNFQEALENYHVRYGEFLRTCSQIRPEDRDRSGVCGTWSPRLVVAHLAGWQYEAAKRYEAMLQDPEARKSYDEHEFNAQSVEARSAMDWNQSIGDLKKGVLAVQNAVASLMIASPPSFERFTGWLRALGEDFQDHGDQLRMWIE